MIGQVLHIRDICSWLVHRVQHILPQQHGGVHVWNRCELYAYVDDLIFTYTSPRLEAILQQAFLRAMHPLHMARVNYS